MKSLSLRPHHALCAQFFEGKGYSERFVENMREVLACLNNENPAIRLTVGCDVLCSACPNRVGGVCLTDEKVRGIDGRALEALKLKAGETIPWNKLSERAERDIIRAGKLGDVCRDCEWIGICAGKSADNK